MVVVIVIARIAQVAVIEVYPSRSVVMIRRFVHVGHAGHGAERKIEGTATQHEELTHPEIVDDARSRRKPTRTNWRRRSPLARMARG
jgi:hypothetical protein